LRIKDLHNVEIESKKRVLPKQAKALKKYLQKKTKHAKSNFFLDQFLDTPRMELFRKGASLRLRYKKGGSLVYLQYKGPGFIKGGVLYRSEFSSARLRHIFMEESHHDIVHFTQTPLQKVIRKQIPAAMRGAMTRHLGAGAVKRISRGPIICVYQKEKFWVSLKNGAGLEPSLDRVSAFHINKAGLHPLSCFSEYENEIKCADGDLRKKMAFLPALLKFDAKLAQKFDLRPERLDKYHRCASFFVPSRLRP
jgi:hypothetical protein